MATRFPSNEADRAVAAMAGGSRAGVLLARTLETIQTAWRSSATRSWLAAVPDHTSTNARARVRAGAWIGLTAGITALVFQRAGSRLEPLTWIVPAVALVLSAAIFLAAREPAEDRISR
jgi:hypothetical protein